MYISAILCFIAWKEAIGLPNANLPIAYSFAMSMQASAPPNCSNANRTAAWSSISCKATHPSWLEPKISASASLNFIEA